MIKTREEWLNTAFERLIPTVEKHGKVPDSVHVLCSWPSKSIRKTIGECYKPEWTKDNSIYITISPMLKEPKHVLHTLLHELVHAIGANGHGKKFQKICTHIGLINEGSHGTLDDEHRRPDLESRFDEILQELGEYPHVQLLPPVKEASESEGEEKKKPYVKCVNSDTGYWVYLKTKLFEEMGAPLDPKTGKPLEVVKDEDE